MTEVINVAHKLKFYCADFFFVRQNMHACKFSLICCQAQTPPVLLLCRTPSKHNLDMHYTVANSKSGVFLPLKAFYGRCNSQFSFYGSIAQSHSRAKATDFLFPLI